MVPIKPSVPYPAWNGNMLQLIERVIVGYSATVDTVFITGKTYYKNTGTVKVPVYTALVENTDWIAGANKTIDNIPIASLFVYSASGVASVERTKDTNGLNFALIAGAINCKCAQASENKSLLITALNGATVLSGHYLSLLTASGFRQSSSKFFVEDGYWLGRGLNAVGLGPHYSGSMTAQSYDMTNMCCITDYPYITKLRVAINDATIIPSGTIVEFWGVKNV